MVKKNFQPFYQRVWMFNFNTTSSLAKNIMNLFGSTNQIASVQNTENPSNNLTTPPTSGSMGTNASGMSQI